MTRFFALIAGFSVLVLFGCKNNERVNPPGLEDDDTGDDDIADDDFCGSYQGQTSNHALARIPRGSDSIRPIRFTGCLSPGGAALSPTLTQPRAFAEHLGQGMSVITSLCFEV